MAELPPELIHVILTKITDYRIILAEESRYVRHVMIPGKHLSIYEFPDSHSRLPPAGLDSPAGPFTGTIRTIDFAPWQDFKYLCCIRRLVRRAKHLEQITMDLMEGSDRSWLIAYINICVGHPGVTFTLNGGEGHISITNSHRMCSSDTPASPTNGFSRLYQQLKSTAPLKHVQPGSQATSGTGGLVTPRIGHLKLVNENLFSSPLGPVVRSLAGGRHITSFTFSNARNYNYSAFTKDGVTSLMATFATLNLPSLTRLSIAHILLPMGPLIHFLTRHQLTTDLYLDLLHPFLSNRHISFKSLLIDWTAPASPTKRFLPNLVRLGGSAYSVLPFVQWRQLKDHSGGDAGHLPALQELELRTGSEPGTVIGSTTWSPPHQQTSELNAVYDALFCVKAPSLGSSTLHWKSSSSKPLKPPNPEAKTHIHNLTLETLSCSHFIDWLMHEAVKRQAWPVLSDHAGASIETLMISEPQTFLIALKMRAELLNALGQWCPDLTREIVTDGCARRWHAEEAGRAYAALYNRWPDVDTDTDSDSDTPVDGAVEEPFTQYLLERVIWHTFPNLQMLHVGDDKRGRPLAQQIST